MLITVTTSSSKLDSLLTSELTSIMNRPQNAGLAVTIQNLWWTDIFIETYQSAIVLESLKVGSWWGSISVTVNNLGDINLISQTSNNANIRVLVI